MTQIIEILLILLKLLSKTRYKKLRHFYKYDINKTLKKYDLIFYAKFKPIIKVYKNHAFKNLNKLA